MPSQIRIGNTPFVMDDANASTIQSMIDNAIEAAGKRSDAKADEATKRADRLEAVLKVIRDNARKLVGRWNHLRGLFDAKKAVMATCEECGGTGKVDGTEEGKQVTCDFCDGEGSYRMHSPIGGKAGAGKDDDDTDPDDPDGDIEDELGDKEMDADELEVEQSTEEEAGKANPKGDRARSKRRKDSRTQRRQEYLDQQAQLAASRQRMIDRAVLSRVKLQDRARKVLGEEYAFAGKTDKAIKVAVVEKLNDGMKLDGKSDAVINDRFDVSMARFEGDGGTASSAAVAATAPHLIVDAARGKGDQPRGRAAFQARNATIADSVSKGKDTAEVRKIGGRGDGK